MTLDHTHLAAMRPPHVNAAHLDAAPAATPHATTAVRSTRADVRNPMLAIPEVQDQWQALPPEARNALVAMLNAMSKTFRERGNTAWRRHKPPVAAYWKASAVNCRHLALAGRATLSSGSATLRPGIPEGSAP